MLADITIKRFFFHSLKVVIIIIIYTMLENEFLWFVKFNGIKLQIALKDINYVEHL